MKIQYCSDLHLEFKENKNFLKQYPIEPIGEILLLAGDILPFALHKQPCEFIDFAADNFEVVYWIPGNHEYYHFDLGTVASPLLEKFRENIFLLNNQTISYKNVNIICSTLWSNISAQNEFAVQQNVNDFHLIKMNGSKFTPAHFNQLHQRDLAFLKKAVAECDAEKTIVMTHHVPTLMNYPVQYKDNNINEAFAVELYDFIYSSNVPYWIYGHHHFNTPEFKIRNTTMLTNQLGYVQQDEHAAFKTNAIIEI
ncbi:MAG TPA: metallophosphoesterase [Chitinophagaceae bacterium]|nr:metallophosphoesterase [Chitinophagaceae bacterium]